MILDLFCLLGAFAAGSCRETQTSIYIWVIVLLVFIYVVVHILVFLKVVHKPVNNCGDNKFLKVVRKLKTFVENKLGKLLSKFHVQDVESTSSRRTNQEKEELEETRKFLMLFAIFVATITYQAGLSPPGGFWQDNQSGHTPGAFVLNEHHPARFKAFLVCNATAFVASVVIIMLLLSKELSKHGMKSYALWLCMAVDLFGLIGAYAAGCCREIATSFYVMFILVGVLICFAFLVVVFLYKPVAEWLSNKKPVVQRLARLLSWPHCGHNSLDGGQQTEDGLSGMEAQFGDDQQAAFAELRPLSTKEISSTEPDMNDGSSDRQSLTSMNRNTALTDPVTKDSLPEKYPSSAQGKRAGTDQPAQVPDINSHHCGADFNSSVSEVEMADTNQLAGPLVNLSASGNQNNQFSKNSNDIDADEDDPMNKLFMKSRTYLLLLAILAVSVTYLAGLNPPAGFQTVSEAKNLPGDPILEDTYHARYTAFFYCNATAFVTSLVIIIMVLNKSFARKTMRRRVLQTTMIVDLFSLMVAYAVGSCRQAGTSIYISLLIFGVFAYVLIHILIVMHVIPRPWKDSFDKKLEHVLSCCQAPMKPLSLTDCHQRKNGKELDRRRNLLLTLATLAASVTFQAGLNPPGGVWPDGQSLGIKGDPVLLYYYSQRYNVFFIFNSTAFVASLAIIVLLLNEKSSEHGIKYYALRTCLVVALIGLLGAYAAGSCRNMVSSVYVLVIVIAVFVFLVIQFLLLRSTQNAYGRSLRKLTTWLSGKSVETEELPKDPSPTDREGGPAKKSKKKRHKYLSLLAILAASVAYQGGLNPPGGVWSVDSPPTGDSVLQSMHRNSHYYTGDPVLQNVHPHRYAAFFCLNAFSFMTSLVVIMLLLSKSVRKANVSLKTLHLIMVLDLLALMGAYAVGSARRIRTSVYVFLLVFGVLIYVVVVAIVSSGVDKWLNEEGKQHLPEWLCRILRGCQLISGTNSEPSGEHCL